MIARLINNIIWLSREKNFWNIGLKLLLSENECSSLCPRSIVDPEVLRFKILVLTDFHRPDLEIYANGCDECRIKRILDKSKYYTCLTDTAIPDKE